MSAKLPPFYENFDNSHCTQCALRGILEYFEPEEKWSWEEWERFTDKEPDKWTWQYRGQINMLERGYDVVAINSENVDVFLSDGIYETFARTLGQVAADELRRNCNLDNAKEDMVRFKQLVERGVIRHELRVPTLGDIKSLLEQEYLLDCALNSYRLRGENGYASHMVLIYAMDNENIHIHDSSIEHGGSQLKIQLDRFIAACTDPTPDQWAITAYKKL